MMFMPEVGDEVAVMFEDGEPERPVIVGSVWNGVQQAPRYDFRGADIATNDVKRIVTKSGNRLHLSDKPGEETVFLATPNTTSLSMTEKSDKTGRNLIHIHSDGDIVLTAGGRVHIQSQTFSREIGVSALPESGAPDASIVYVAPAASSPFPTNTTAKKQAPAKAPAPYGGQAENKCGSVPSSSKSISASLHS